MRSSLLCLFLWLMLAEWGLALPKDFTDPDLEKALQQQSRVLFYSFSPGMQLSVSGLNEIRNAASDVRAQVVFLLDPLTTEAELVASSIPADILLQIQYQKSRRLRDLGIQLHYPSVVVSGNHRLVGAPIAGFKSREGYVTLVSDALKLSWKETFQVSKEVELPRPMGQQFFKPLYGTDFIILGWASYLFNVKTSEILDIGPFGGDSAASPDGEFITFISGGLSWLAVSDIFAKAPVLLLKDPGLRTYQSMGLLPASSTYRVLGAESSSTAPTGLLFRDYQPIAREGGGKTITPISSWQRLCDDKRISIPMMSKTGLYLSGMHEGTLRAFRIGEKGTQCVEVFDSQSVTGKADFSVDDRTLIYVSRAQGPTSTITVDTLFLADLSANRAKPIYHAPEGSQLFFPGFLNSDEIVVYDRASKKMIVIARTRTVD